MLKDEDDLDGTIRILTIMHLRNHTVEKRYY